MKQNSIPIIFICVSTVLIALIVGIVVDSKTKIINTNPQQIFSDNNKENYYQSFDDYGFAITAPCKLRDVSHQSSGDFVVNYAGVINENNLDKVVFYQVMAIDVPIGYKDLSNSEYEELVDTLIKSSMSKMSNCKKVKFGYEEYNGYVGETIVNGYRQKGVTFCKENLIITLTVITNDGLNEKFNEFTNSFRNIPASCPIKMERKPSVVLEKQYSNKYFNLKYPSSWQIIQDDNQVTNNTAIYLQVMEIQKNNSDFRPSVNIIVSSQKRMESASELARVTIMQQKQYFGDYNLIRQTNNIVLSKANGCVIEYQVNVQGYLLYGIQYIVKKPDNTTFTITGTMDASKYQEQQNIIEKIIKSLIIK